MEPLDTYLNDALLSWAYWTGRKECVQEVRERGVGFLQGRSSQIHLYFSKLLAGLYFPLSAHRPCATNILDQTWTDVIYNAISKELDVPPKPLWPDDHPYAFLLTHDIDRTKMTYQEALSHFQQGNLFAGVVSLLKQLRNLLGGSAQNPYNNFQNILRQEKAWGIKSTLFILKEKRRIEELYKMNPQHFFGVYDPKDIEKEIEELKKNGHELGLHLSLGAYYSPKDMNHEKHCMEWIWREKLKGARSHYLMFAAKTPKILSKEGFFYDSSMGFNFHNGFRCGTAFPFLLEDSGKKSLWEIPLHLMDTALWAQAKASKETETLERLVSPIVKQVAIGQGLLMVNWHQRYFNASVEPELYQLMGNLISKVKSEGAWMTTPSELLEWWVEKRPEM